MSSSSVTGNVDLRLRPIAEEDLTQFFRFQLDPEALRMAAFTAKDPADEHAFRAHWQRIMSDERIVIRSIQLGEELVGSVLAFPMDDRYEISYWIDRSHWGKGVATLALQTFLAEIPFRPLRARVASDNLGSIRVLQKCGFVHVADMRGYANARGEEIDEQEMELRG